jgi:hypothetical protein
MDRLLTTLAAMTVARLVGFGQDPALQQRFYPEDVHEDLQVLRRTIEQSHPDPFRYHTKVEMDLLFQSVDTSLRNPVTAEGFIRAVMPVLKAMGDANTSLGLPAAQAELYSHSVPLIPITVGVLGGKLYVDQELKGFRSFPPGSELLRINGRLSSRILATLRASQVPEGANTTRTDRRIGLKFPELYRRFVEDPDGFTIDYRAPDGTQGTKTVHAMTRDEMDRSMGQRGFRLRSWRMEELRDVNTGWLTLESLDRKGLEKEGIAPEKFLSSVREAVRRDRLTTLVIDLRGAGGEDTGLADQVFSLIAKTPYRLFRAMSVRSGNIPDSYKYAQPAPEFYASLGTDFMPEPNGRMGLKPDDPRLQMTSPEKDAFQGTVYVLCDGGTVDAAAALVMLAKRSHRATLVGEETGSNATSYCAGQVLQITLPRTGCILRLPLVRFVPDGNPGTDPARGELPDHVVTQLPNGLANGTDVVRNALVQLIGELQ